MAATLTVYATSTDLATWTGQTTPSNATQLLRSASIRVALACNRNPYGDTPDVDAAGPLRDATTATVAAWTALGINPDAGGLDQLPAKAVKILTADVQNDTTGALTARQQAAAMIGPEARAILQLAGLLYVYAADLAADALLPDWGTGSTVAASGLDSAAVDALNAAGYEWVDPGWTYP